MAGFGRRRSCAIDRTVQRAHLRTTGTVAAHAQGYLSDNLNCPITGIDYSDQRIRFTTRRRLKDMTNNEQRDGVAGDSQLGDRCLICEKAERALETGGAQGFAGLPPADRKHAVEHTMERLEARGAIRRSGIRRPARNGKMLPIFEPVPQESSTAESARCAAPKPGQRELVAPASRMTS
jgi:hypothetical protein